MSQLWYVVHTKARQELLAAGLLEQRLAAVVLLPQVRQRTRGQMRTAPLFPGYLFVQLDLEQTEASAVNNTPGVIRLVAFGGVPKPVPARVIAALQARLAEIDSQGGLPQHPFREGDRVRLTGGPLAGLEAVFVGPMRPAERVRVLLEFLGQEQEALVPVEDLEPAGGHTMPKRPRRTRGKGRPIRTGSDHQSNVQPD
jgi:transcriptional antiterminator RfaH